MSLSQGSERPMSSSVAKANTRNAHKDPPAQLSETATQKRDASQLQNKNGIMASRFEMDSQPSKAAHEQMSGQSSARACQLPPSESHLCNSSLAKVPPNAHASPPQEPSLSRCESTATEHAHCVPPPPPTHLLSPELWADLERIPRPLPSVHQEKCPRLDGHVDGPTTTEQKEGNSAIPSCTHVASTPLHKDDLKQRSSDLPDAGGTNFEGAKHGSGKLIARQTNGTSQPQSHSESALRSTCATKTSCRAKEKQSSFSASTSVASKETRITQTTEKPVVTQEKSALSLSAKMITRSKSAKGEAQRTHHQITSQLATKAKSCKEQSHTVQPLVTSAELEPRPPGKQCELQRSGALHGNDATLCTSTPAAAKSTSASASTTKLAKQSSPRTTLSKSTSSRLGAPSSQAKQEQSLISSQLKKQQRIVSTVDAEALKKRKQNVLEKLDQLYSIPNVECDSIRKRNAFIRVASLQLTRDQLELACRVAQIPRYRRLSKIGLASSVYDAIEQGLLALSPCEDECEKKKCKSDDQKPASETQADLAFLKAFTKSRAPERPSKPRMGRRQPLDLKLGIASSSNRPASWAEAAFENPSLLAKVGGKRTQLLRCCPTLSQKRQRTGRAADVARHAVSLAQSLESSSRSRANNLNEEACLFERRVNSGRKAATKNARSEPII